MKKSKDSLGGNALKLSGSNIITVSVSMIIAMLLSRFLTLEEYGTYSQLLLIINLATTLFMLGLPNSISYFLARSETSLEKQKFLSVYYSFSTIISVFIGIAIIISFPLIIEFFNNDSLQNFFYLVALYPWAKITFSGITNVLIVYKKTNLIVYINIAHSLFLLLSVLTMNYLNLRFETFMVLFLIIEVIFGLLVYVIVKRVSGKLYINIDKLYIRKILSFSIPIGLATAVGTINIQFDKLIIGKYLDTEKLAIYTNASRELPVAIIVTSLTAVLIPLLVKVLKKNQFRIAATLWSNSIVLSFGVICFLSLCFFTFAPDIMTFLYSEKYLPGVGIFRIYCLVLLLRFTYFGIILNSIGKSKFIFYSSLASLGVNIIMNYILFYYMGITGPAIATFLSQLAMNLVQLVFTCRILKISVTEIFPWKIMTMILFANIFMSAVFYYLKMGVEWNLYVGSLVESILLGLIWMLLFLTMFFKVFKINWSALNRGER